MIPMMLLNKPFLTGCYNLFKRLLPILALLALAAMSYRAGYQNRDTKAVAEAAKVEAEHKEAQLKAEQAYSAQVAAVAAEKQRWFDYAQEQAVNLADANRRLARQTVLIKQEIPHAIRDNNAGGCHSGLGADGLRLYRQALGYPAN